MGCRVRQNRHGQLTLFLNYRGRRWSEGTSLRDTAANRQRVLPIADAVNAEMKLGSFAPDRYLYFFPNGNRAAEFTTPEGVTATPAATVERTTVRAFFECWIRQQRPPIVRTAQGRDYRQHLTRYVLDAVIDVHGSDLVVGDIALAELRTVHLRALQAGLLERGLAVKTVRNIIDASFRAMVREARVDEYLESDPFAALRWPRVTPSPPDPFSEEERDRLVNWFAARKPFYHPFVVVLFHTGMRPSEAVGLRWGDVDTREGFIRISRSRYCGDEAATKTRNSERTIRLVPAVREVLQDLKPLHADAADFVFTNSKNGGPIDQREWPKDHWRQALRGAGVRHRKFYATRHTFISVGLTKGLNLKFLAEYCGTSVAMIERSYGRFLASHVDEQLALLQRPDQQISTPALAVGAEAKMQTRGAGFAVPVEKPLWSKASPTGFEPVSPA